MKPLITALVRNIFFSSVSFFIVGLIGLMIVPVIIKFYGVLAYGIIVFTRSFLPSGLLGIFDCGVTEVATKISARQRVTNQQNESGNSLASVMLLSILVGVTLALMVGIFTPYLPKLLANSDRLNHIDVRNILLATAASLPIIFPGLVIEGVVRGCENFLLVRTSEIVSALTYAGLVLLGVHFNQHYSWVAYTFLFAAFLKTALLGVWVYRQGLLSSKDIWQVTRGDLRQTFCSGLLFAQSKMMGTIQTQLPVLLIGFISGAAGSAIYDVIMRLPRFFKSVLGLTMSVIFPVSARLDAHSDKTVVRKLLASGLAIVMFLYYPLITGFIVFSKKIMAVWVDTGLIMYWPWMALMFSALLTNVLLSYALTIGSVRELIQKRVNKLFFYQAVLQFCISFLLVPIMAERAFIVGLASAMVIFFPWQMSALLRDMEISDAGLVNSMLRHACIFAVLAGFYHFTVPVIEERSLLALVLLMSGWIIVYTLLSYVLVLDSHRRGQLKMLVTVLRR